MVCVRRETFKSHAISLGMGFFECRGGVFKPRQIIQEYQFDAGVGGTIAVLGDDDFGNVLARAVFIQHIRAVDEHDNICILFQAAGFAQIGKHRACLSVRCSTARESWAAASTGTFNSRASTFRLREM